MMATPYGRQSRLPQVGFAPPAIGQDEVAEVVATLESGWLSTGPRVQQFERAFADYVGASHAVAVNSGTAALHLSLLAAGVGTGDEVVTTPLTFCATANVDRARGRDASLRRHRCRTAGISVLRRPPPP